jgi:hypothetical protein
VVFPNYSLSPEAKYPTAIQECYAVARWVAAHGQERVAELLRVDLAEVTDAAERVAPYITADGRRLWSVKLIERAIDPNAPAWLRRRAGAAPKTPPTLAG